ncbi:myosin-like protein XIF [Perilla frutescens var. hirtella]|nr:myosin-like protein XIF [Perilla frutescens var. hirtella]KAH6811982.1 myosin-like protein XIF [Perilla frutescens var. frutescens]
MSQKDRGPYLQCRQMSTNFTLSDSGGLAGIFSCRQLRQNLKGHDASLLLLHSLSFILKTNSSIDRSSPPVSSSFNGGD